MTEKVKLFGVSWKDLLAVWREGPTVIYLIGPHKVQHLCESEAAAEEYASFITGEWIKVLEGLHAERKKRSKFAERISRYLKRMEDEIDEGEEWKKNNDDE